MFRLAGQVDGLDPGTLGYEMRYRWVYLFPVIAARLQAGDTSAAVESAARIIDPSQQWLPDDLTAALTRARDDPAQAVGALTEALSLARTHAYF